MKKLWLFLGILLLTLIVLSLRPVSEPNEKNLVYMNSVVQSIESSEHKDIMIRLEGDDHTYYINRGMERAPDIISNIKVKNAVEIAYIRHWTPLDPASNMRHVAVIALNGEELYSER